MAKAPLVKVFKSASLLTKGRSHVRLQQYKQNGKQRHQKLSVEAKSGQ